MGIKYEQVSKVTNQSDDDDWKKFIRPTGKLTRTGQLLLQKATEAYVYSVLGAQARTHWTIVGAGARSLHTQEIFTKIVKDSVAQVAQVMTSSKSQKRDLHAASYQRCVDQNPRKGGKAPGVSP